MRAPQAGEWLVRIEDVDTTRTVPGAADDILRTLEAFGLHWDGEVTGKPPHRSTRRRSRACRLSAPPTAASARAARSRIRACRASTAGVSRHLPRLGLGASRAVRFGVAGRIAFRDAYRTIEQDLRATSATSCVSAATACTPTSSRWWSTMPPGITDVVRGADLLWSTPRQVALQRALGYPTPRYLHVPVATNERGEKLSKQTLAPDRSAAGGGLAGGPRVPPPAAGRRRPPRAILAQAAAPWNPAS
jgi:glutamyl-Q tRNA(Asp) synthetase